MWRWGVVAVLVVVSLLVSSDTAHVAPARADDSDERAIEVAAERTGISRSRLRIAQATEARFPTIGLAARAYKVEDAQTGRLEGVLLDKGGKVLDARAVEQAEAQARLQKYGRLAPELAQKVQATNATTKIGVNIWLKESIQQRQTSRPDPNRRGGGASVSPATVDTALQQAQVQRQSEVSALTTPIVQRLRGLGLRADASGLAPNIVSALTPAEIRTVSSWPEVDTIYPARKGVPHLESMRATVGANVVNNDRGITGAGVRVAVLEVDGRAAHANPWLAPYTQDQTYVCETPDAHVTAVAGVVRSTHPTNRGIAPDALLWVGGACGQTDTAEEWDAHMQNRSQAAVDWGARALNLSWGSEWDFLPAPGAMDRFYDDIHSSYGRLVVVAAGNEGATDNPYLSNPAMGFNVLSVGNIVDGNTGDHSNDGMNWESSWKDPLSTNGDRQKPEVSAPGTDVTSLLVATPGVGNTGSGTSFAAPVVMGMAALLIQRDSVLGSWPQITKAIIMATAREEVVSTLFPGDQDSVSVDLPAADDVATRTSGNWGGQAYNCSTPTPLALDTFTLAAGQRARAAIVWDQNTAYADYAVKPSADLDLLINGPDGMLVTRSASFDNTYEIVDFTAPTTGTYALRVSRFRCDLTPRWLGWAWWQAAAPTRRLTVTNMNPLSGTVLVNTNGIECFTTCTFDFPVGTEVELTALPEPGSHFSGWSGDCTNASGPCRVTMSADRSVAARFADFSCSPRPRVEVRTEHNGDGRLRVTILTDAGFLQRLQFGDSAQRPAVPTNASITVSSPAGGPSNVTTAFTYTPPANTRSVTLLVARGAGATTVPIVVTDGCGEWRSFFGAG